MTVSELKKDGDTIYWCSFCGKHQDYVEILVRATADDENCICNECIELAVDLMEGKRKEIENERANVGRKASSA